MSTSQFEEAIKAKDFEIESLQKKFRSIDSKLNHDEKALKEAKGLVQTLTSQLEEKDLMIGKLREIANRSGRVSQEFILLPFPFASKLCSPSHFATLSHYTE